jgi:hypothetical protein
MTVTLTALQKQRRDTAANWTAADPTLLAGELGYETDTGYWKVGDGSTAWTSLAYIPGSKLSAYPLVNADIAAAAEIAVSKLANGTANQVLTTDGTDVSWTDSPTIAGNVTIEGNLTVNGTETIINVDILQVEDKSIEIGKVATPTDVTADGGGIVLKGSTDKTITWIDSTDAWTFSEHVNIASGKEYRIAGTSVLSATTLGSGVVNSSLTSVGTISSGVWQGSTVATDHGGTGQTSYTDGQLLIGNSTGNTLSKSTLTAGTGISITNGSGSVTIASTVSGGLPTTGGTLTGDLLMDNQSDVRFGEATANGTNWVAFQGPASIATNITWTLPATDATVAGYALVSDGAGTLSWSAAGGGATGGGTDDVFYENSQTVTTNYTLTTGKNAMSAGPITIDSGITVTVPSGSSWVIV